MKMDEDAIITYKGKKIANYHTTESNTWLILWDKDIPKEDMEKYKKEIEDVAKEMKMEVEFKNG